MQNKRHTHTLTNSLKHIQYKRWKWQQANEPKIERPFKGSKSAMAVTTMGIKTTSTTTTTAAKRTAKQSNRQAAGVWKSSTHASEWEVGWTSTWPRLQSLTVPVCVCLSCLPRSLPAFQYLLCLSISLIYSVCLSVWLGTNLIIYLPAYLPPCILSLHPGVYLCACLPLYIPTVGMGRRRGGGLVKGSQGTHRSACLWSLHYRIWHSARAHLISLRTHTHTPI